MLYNHDFITYKDTFIDNGDWILENNVTIYPTIHGFKFPSRNALEMMSKLVNRYINVLLANCILILMSQYADQKN